MPLLKASRRRSSALVDNRVESISLAGRVALATGGGRGVGKGISMSLAATVADIIANGGKAQAYAASVDDFEQNAEMVAAIEADHGAVGILVNNAGIASRGQSVVDTDPAEMRRVVATHAFGPAIWPVW